MLAAWVADAVHVVPDSVPPLGHEYTVFGPITHCVLPDAGTVVLTSTSPMA
jgi:hypothetical protein